jgi:hypothetical protein
MVSQKKAIGILGIIFTIAGGAAWFFGQYVPAVMLWGVAAIIVLRQNRRSRGKRR